MRRDLWMKIVNMLGGEDGMGRDALEEENGVIYCECDNFFCLRRQSSHTDSYPHNADVSRQRMIILERITEVIFPISPLWI